MKRAISILCLIACLVGSVLLFCSCGGAVKLEVRGGTSQMYAGEKQYLNVYNTDTDRIEPELMFASDDPSVASVDQWGGVLAVAPGETDIIIQSASGLSTKYKISVTYKIENGSTYNVENPKIRIDGTKYKYWEENGYTSRGSNWDVINIGNIILNKGKGEYVFTDNNLDYKITADEVLEISDWTNSDVILSTDLLNEDAMERTIEKYELAYAVKPTGLSRACALAKTQFDKEVARYHGSVKLSALPTDKQYRVVMVVDYDIVRTENYYSQGMFSGFADVGLDILKGDIDSFIDSYTYSENVYELVNFKNAKIVIQSRDN